MSDVAAVFPMVILHAMNAEAPPEPRRHLNRGWCESAETSAVFKDSMDRKGGCAKRPWRPPLKSTGAKTLRTRALP